jgi:hypothetical protein
MARFNCVRMNVSHPDQKKGRHKWRKVAAATDMAFEKSATTILSTSETCGTASTINFWQKIASHYLLINSRSGMSILGFCSR